MRFLQSLMAIWLLFGTSVFAQAQLQTSSPLAPPDVRAWSAPSHQDTSGSTTTRITVEIPEDHHGYLDSGDEGLLIPLAFTFDDPALKAQEIARPQGTRDDQAHATVLRGQGEFVFQLAFSGAIPSAPYAKLRYQICNDVTNICYPPRTVQVPLQLIAAQNSTISQTGTPKSQGDLTQGEAAPTSFRERLAALFRQSTTNLFFAIALVFVAGLIASATPCVYPILPITSAILMARGSGSKQSGHFHAFAYFVGLIFFYTLLGVFAVTTGTALSAAMTNPWVNLGFAILFVYLGLSMLGLYEFQFMPALTAKLDSASSQRGGLSGTFWMGTTAGLIVSPCVGPVVGAILLDITGQAAALSADRTTLPSDIIVRGIALMTSFGAGLGIPFLVVGLLSNRLPQSGTWLTKVKFLLGLPILYFAYTYYIKSLETLGVPGNVAHAMLVGILAIVLAVYVGAFHTTGEQLPQHLQLRRACGIILLVVGIHFLYNGLGRSGILIDRPPSPQIADPPPSDAAAVETHGNLRWLRKLSAARQLARTESKPLFVDFYATWCANCKAFNRLALKHKELNRALQQAVLIKIYDTDPDFKIFQRDQRLPELRGVGGQPFLPLFAIYSPQGEFLWKGQDYQAANTMIAQLERAKHATLP